MAIRNYDELVWFANLVDCPYPYIQLHYTMMLLWGN